MWTNEFINGDRAIKCAHLMWQAISDGLELSYLGISDISVRKYICQFQICNEAEQEIKHLLSE